MPSTSARTTVLYTVAGLSAAAQSSTFCPGNSLLRAQRAFEVTLSAGTASINIEGRTGPNEAWTILATVTASGLSLVAENLEYRVNVTAAAAATIRVNTDIPMRLAAQRTIA